MSTTQPDLDVQAEDPTEGAPALGLTDDELAMLDIERSWWKSTGRKESVIRERFDISSTIYYQRLNAIIDLPAALVHDPLLVRRLRRLREARAYQRSAARLGFEA